MLRIGFGWPATTPTVVHTSIAANIRRLHQVKHTSPRQRSRNCRGVDDDLALTKSDNARKEQTDAQLSICWRRDSLGHARLFHEARHSFGVLVVVLRLGIDLLDSNQAKYTRKRRASIKHYERPSSLTREELERGTAVYRRFRRPASRSPSTKGKEFSVGFTQTDCSDFPHLCFILHPGRPPSCSFLQLVGIRPLLLQLADANQTRNHVYDIVEQE